MKYLRKAAARERRAPILWWFFLMLFMGGVMGAFIWPHSREAACLLVVFLGAAWMAPLVAFQSLSAPPRAKALPPAPGEGSYGDWKKQTHLLGRVLLYQADNKYLAKDTRKAIHAARVDLRDTLKAHPLRDDLERVCGRIRSGVLQQMKIEFWQNNRDRIQELMQAVTEDIVLGLDEDEQLLAIHSATEDAAALMARYCMPRLLERERLACAVDCAWLAVQAAPAHQDQASPIELAARLVIEWSDYSEPWRPARMLRNVLSAMKLSPEMRRPSPVSSVPEPAPAPPPKEAPEPAVETTDSPAVIPEEGNGTPPLAAVPKRRRVRVRVRRNHRRRRKRGPSILDILLSFGQWIRYSIRAWTLYR